MIKQHRKLYFRLALRLQSFVFWHSRCLEDFSKLLYLGGPDFGAEVGLVALAEDALLALALRRVTRDDDVAGDDAAHALAHGLDDGRGLVAQDRGEEALGIMT